MSFYEKIKEPISVIALFEDKNQPKIHKFRWNDRTYHVDRVNMINKMFKGQDVVYMFSVSSNQGAYKLQFNTSNLEWRLEEVYWE